MSKAAALGVRRGGATAVEQLLGRVLRIPPQVQPAMMEIGTLTAAETRTADVTIANEGNKPMRLLYGLSPDVCVAASVARQPIASRASAKIAITVSAKGKRPVRCA